MMGLFTLCTSVSICGDGEHISFCVFSVIGSVMVYTLEGLCLVICLEEVYCEYASWS